MYNYIIDVKDFSEFNEANNITNYDELMVFFKKFDRKYYDVRRIHNHWHHIIPKCEGGTDEDGMVCLPYRYHIKAHYLRAKEQEETNDLFNAYKNYKSVQYSIEDSSIPKSIQELEKKLDFVCEAIQKRRELRKYAKEIYIKRNGKTLKIYEKDFGEYQKDGWEKGRIFKNPKGKIWLNNGIKNMYMLKEESEEFLKNNPEYKKGFLSVCDNSKKASYSTLGTKWINKDGEHKSVKIELLQKYLDVGWELGHKTWSQTTKDRKKIYIGKKEKVINREDLQYYFNLGWKLGSPKRCIINNGKITKNIYIDDLKEFLSQGWKRGTLKNNKD
jgi:hypothetical protein